MAEGEKGWFYRHSEVRLELKVKKNAKNVLNMQNYVCSIDQNLHFEKSNEKMHQVSIICRTK